MFASLTSFFKGSKAEDLSKLTMEELKQKNEERVKDLNKRVKGIPVNVEKLNDGLVGLSNLGNTCYMNSSIQCLTKSHELNEYLLNMKWLGEINAVSPLGSKGDVLVEYFNFLRTYYLENDESSISPSDLRKAICRGCPQVPRD